MGFNIRGEKNLEQQVWDGEIQQVKSKHFTQTLPI